MCVYQCFIFRVCDLFFFCLFIFAYICRDAEELVNVFLSVIDGTPFFLR